jgi:hypothetical protein
MTHEQAVEVAARPDIEAEARRDALGEAADEADRMVDAGLGGLCGTAIRALGDEPATEAAGDADELPPLPPEAVAQMRAIAADHDEAPLRDAWRRGAEAMRDKIADSSYELRIALAHLLPPYQPKEPTP